MQPKRVMKKPVKYALCEIDYFLIRIKGLALLLVPVAAGAGQPIALARNTCSRTCGIADLGNLQIFTQKLSHCVVLLRHLEMGFLEVFLRHVINSNQSLHVNRSERGVCCL